MRTRERNIIIQSFYSPTSNSYRKLRIHLPESYYESSDKRYPVLYMHDGQNVFDPSDAVFGMSWEADTTADRLAAEGRISEIIIVGIDNMPNRAEEYCHFKPKAHAMGRMGTKPITMDYTARGEEYEKFIIGTVKPYIDANYRTLPDRANTALMGSSMGGNITYFIGMRNPDVFSKLGVISPAFNYVDMDKVLSVGKKPLTVWMDAGECEAYYIDNCRCVLNKMISDGYVPGKDLFYYQAPGAVHSEPDWAKRLHAPLILMFGEIGEPTDVRLYGRNTVSVDGDDAYINPVVTYDSSFVMSDLNASYSSSSPEVMNVAPDGKITVHSTGESTVTYKSKELTASAYYNAVETLPKTVTVSIDIYVPDGTNENDKIRVFIGKMTDAERVGDHYHLALEIPIGWGYHFGIFSGDDFKPEADEYGNRLKDRTFVANDDMTIVCNVAAWQKHAKG